MLRFPYSANGSSGPKPPAKPTSTLQHFVVAESPYTYKLFAIIPLTDFKRIQVGEVRTRLTLRDGVIQIDTTLLQANEWRLHVSGSHTLKNDLSYHLTCGAPSQPPPEKPIPSRRYRGRRRTVANPY